MKIFLTKVFTCGILLLVGCPYIHAERSIMEPWTIVKNSHAHFEAAFPHQPAELEFDILRTDPSPQGHLQVYLAPIKKGAFFVCVLTSESLSEKDLDAKNFQDLFHSYFVLRMLYDPHSFENTQKYHQTKLTFDGAPAIDFTYEYEEKQISKKLSGIAILKDNQIYIVFYLASEKDFDENDLKKLINSFHFV